MKVVDLVSGGKDSCYAMMKCIQYGHDIVVLANLLPVDDWVDELDSYMYQTLCRERIAERIRALQELVPTVNKTDKAAMIDEIVDYVKFLRLQIKDTWYNLCLK